MLRKWRFYFVLNLEGIRQGNLDWLLLACAAYRWEYRLVCFLNHLLQTLSLAFLYLSVDTHVKDCCRFLLRARTSLPYLDLAYALNIHARSVIIACYARRFHFHVLDLWLKGG